MWFLSCAFALELSQVSWKGDTYTVVHLEPTDRVELVGQADPEQRTLAGALAAHPEASVAMNAGMYHRGYTPVGAHVESGQTFNEAVRTAGPGNFGMLPNGVFTVADGVPAVHRTERWQPRGEQLVTQSGPMLVLDGRLHPRFRADGTSRKIRNAVGVRDGHSWWVVSTAPVRFHDLATLFRDHLQCPDALFLDGTVSELATRETVRDGRTFSGVLVASAGRRR